MIMAVKTAIKHWPQVAPLLTKPRRESDYQKLVQALDEVLDAGGADERHPLASLAGALGDLVADYESAHLRKKEMPVSDFLRELMRQRGLRQSDLPEIGTQSVVSEVLNGKRHLNVPQIARLCQRFNLPADALMP